MDIEQFREELKRDEGVKNEIYLDHLGLPTCGIGHLITEWDEEFYEKPIGTKVPNEQVNDWFEKDIKVTISDCKIIFSNFC